MVPEDIFWRDPHLLLRGRWDLHIRALEEEEIQMPQLHQRGVELVYELVTAADHVEKMKHEEVAALLRETASVLGDLLQRDVQDHPAEKGSL